MEVEHFVVRYDHMKENFVWSFKQARFLSLERKISLSRNAIRILMRKFWSQNASMKEALLLFNSDALSNQIDGVFDLTLESYRFATYMISITC